MPSNTRFASKYKMSHTFELRKQEADKVRLRHPDRLPVICEKVEKSKIADLDKNKFLIPSDLTVSQFIMVVRRRIMVDDKMGLFLFINEAVPSGITLMQDLYAKYMDEDGFLYVKYASENSFGGGETSF